MNHNENKNEFSSHVPKRRRNDITPEDQKQRNINEQNKTQVSTVNKKKPFFKRWWFWLLIVLVIAAIIMTTFLFLNKKPSPSHENDAIKSTTSSKVSKNGAKTSKKKAQDTPASKRSTSTPSSQIPKRNKASGNAAIGNSGTAIEVFNDIKLGDTAQNGAGGDTETELKKKLSTDKNDGQQIKEEQIDYVGKTAKKIVWGSVIGINQGSGTMVIFIQDGQEYRAVSKTCVGISGDVPKEKFNLAKYQALDIKNLNAEEAVETLGQPNAMTLSIIDGSNISSYTWNTDLEGDHDASVTINFTNNIATSKDQKGLK
jgi:hypothetical protein